MKKIVKIIVVLVTGVLIVMFVVCPVIEKVRKRNAEHRLTMQ